MYDHPLARLCEAKVVAEPLEWRRRAHRAGLHDRIIELIRESYENNTPMQVPVPLSGEVTPRRGVVGLRNVWEHGKPWGVVYPDRGVDRNVSVLVNALRRIARDMGYGLKTSVDVDPENEDRCLLTFLAGELSRRPKS